ncbi:class I SAM-dependent methyltransferase [Frateuria sp. YIM B11624]|uniref:class I SAM-dependent methyltransferase n=1 Tax=Frateuria sp. YIM B11624 TaxID=3143185 RepID=UPI003C784180
MKRPLLAAALLALAAAASAKTSGNSIAAAIADPARPATDKAQDADRKPAEVLAFAGIHRGDVVVDLMPGAGYYTRLFSRLVGPTGKVYALDPSEMATVASKSLATLKAFAGKGEYANVVVLVQPLDALELPQPADAVWTSQNYHDLHDPFMGSPDVGKLDQHLRALLKPGGTFLVLDHTAAPGTGFAHTNDLHRVDPAAVKKEVAGAGFQFVAASDALRNPADDHTAAVFDPKIKGHTDKFLLKFRKPK